MQLLLARDNRPNFETVDLEMNYRFRLSIAQGAVAATLRIEEHIKPFPASIPAVARGLSPFPVAAFPRAMRSNNSYPGLPRQRLGSRRKSSATDSLHD